MFKDFLRFLLYLPVTHSERPGWCSPQKLRLSMASLPQKMGFHCYHMSMVILQACHVDLCTFPVNGSPTTTVLVSSSSIAVTFPDSDTWRLIGRSAISVGKAYGVCETVKGPKWFSLFEFDQREKGRERGRLPETLDAATLDGDWECCNVGWRLRVLQEVWRRGKGHERVWRRGKLWFI